MAIDFSKYGQEKTTTPGGSVVNWNKYGAPLVAPTIEDTTPKPFKFDVAETRQAKIRRMQTEAQKLKEESDKANSITERWIRPIADSILPGAASLGDTVGSIINTNKNTDVYNTAFHNIATTQVNLVKKINEQKRLGKDTTSLMQLYNEGVDQLTSLQDEYNQMTAGARKSTKQVGGELGMTALNILLAGTYGKATQGMKMGSLAVEGPVSALVSKAGIPSNIVTQSGLPTAISKATGLLSKPSKLFTKEGLKNVALGAGIGEAFDITQMMQEDKSGTDLLTGGYAKYIGAAIPTLIEGTKGVSGIFSKEGKLARDLVVRKDLGNAYRDTIGKYTRTQTMLDTAENINKTDPISIFEMYGKETVPTMTSNGRVDPANQIDFLNKKIKELSEIKSDAIFLNDNVVTAEEYSKYIDNIIDGQRSWTPAKKLATKKEVAKIFRDIEAAQEGKSFEMLDIDKIKTEQTGLSKSYKNPQAKFSYDAHSVIGKASRDLVEMFSDDVAVKDLNKLIQGHYDAIDILNALRGKTPKGGMMSKHFSRVSGQLLGYSAGTAIGHPFLGMAGGQIIANELQGIIQSSFITNPLKRLMINNLKEQAPREVAAVLKSMEAKYGEVFAEMGLEVSKSTTKWTPEMAKKKLPAEESAIPTESYIKQGLREGKELGQIIIDYAKDIKNKGGLSIQDVSKGVPAEKSAYNIGLSAVKGRIRQPLDDLAEQADALLKEGKIEEAQKLFDKITMQAQRIIQNRFRGTGIEIKMKGTGFGVYEGKPEPNIDFTAIVKPEQDDLFHQILTDIANNDFKQESFLTHRPISPDSPIGMVDKVKGIRNEPYHTITFKKPLELKDIPKVNKALEDVGLKAMTLKEGNSKLDLLHLTEYNGNDYEKWIKQKNDFRDLLNKQGLIGDEQQGLSQTRFVGSDTSGATTTYKRSAGDFYKKNKEYINPDINSKVLDAIKYRKEISVGELESIVNSGEISPTEKVVFKEVLDSFKGKASKGKIKADLREPEWYMSREDGQIFTKGNELTPDKLKVGAIISKHANYPYIVTDVLKDGKFKGMSLESISPEEIKLIKKGDIAGASKLRTKETPDFNTYDKMQETFEIPTSSKFTPKETNINKIKTADLQKVLRGKLLTLEPKVSSKYEAYGFDNLNIDRPAGAAHSIVFDSNLKHGKGKSHFEEEGIFGHGRYFKDYDDIAYIGEIQSDVFQHTANIEYIKNFQKQEIAKLKESLKYAETVSMIPEDEANRLKVVAKIKKQIDELEKELNTKTNKDQQLLIDQFVNFARGDKYRDRLVQETINYINKTEKPKEIRLPTPSTVAKIEGFAGGEDFAPYEVIEGGNGRVGQGAEDLTYGDVIDMGGQRAVVVDVQAQGRGWGGPAPTGITVAPEDKVTIWNSLNDVIAESADNRISDIKYEIKDELAKGITPKQAQKMVDDGSYDWATEQMLKKVADGDTTLNGKTFDDFAEEIKDKVYESESEMYSADELQGMGYSHVGFEDISRGRGQDYKVYLVEDGITPESFDQPSAYSAGTENLLEIDTDMNAAKEMFGDTQMGVLENYYKIQDEFIPKLEKIIGKKIESTEDGSGNTWWKIDPETLKNTAFAIAPIGVLSIDGNKKK